MAHRGHIGKTLRRIAVVAVSLGAALAANAATKVWNDGGGATTNWSTTTDWVGGVAPVSGDSLVFAGTLGLTNNNNILANTSFGGITFSNNAGAFLLAGNAIKLTGDVINNSANTETINLAISLSNTINLNAASGNLTLGGALSGAGGVTLTGNNVVTLNGGATANTYSGMTTVNAGELDLAKTAGTAAIGGGLTVGGGTVKLVNANEINDTASVTVNSGTFNLNGNSETIDALAGTGGTIINNGAAAGTLTIDASNGSGTYSGTITNGASGVLALTKGGTGTGTLTGNNGYSGATTINGGVLSVNSLANGGASSGIGNSGSQAVNLVLNGGALQYTGPAATIDRLFSVGTSGGTIDSSGSGGLTLNNTGAMGFNGQTGTRTLNLAGTAMSNTLAAVIGDNTGATSVSKTGAGTWALSGNNTYTGVTAINGGVLEAKSATAFGTGSITLNGGVLGLGAADLTKSLGTSAGSLQFVGSGGFAAYGAARNVSLSGGAALTWASTANFLANGSTLILGASDADNTVTFQNAINFNAAVRTIQVNRGSGGEDAILSGVLSGTGASGFTETGNGNLELTGSSANTFAGLATVNGGELDLGKTAGIDAITAGGLTLGGGTVKLINSDQINNAAAVTINSGTFDLNGNNESFNVLSGTGGTIVNNGGSTGTLTIGANNGGGTYSGTIADGSSTLVLVKTGTGTGTLSGNNGYSGGTTISGGTLSVSSLANGGASSGIGDSGSQASSLVLNGGALQYTGGAANIDRLFSVGTSGGALDASGSGALTLNNTGAMGFNGQSGARTLTLTGSSVGNNTLAAQIGDNGGATTVAKTGAGTWVLSGSNNYSGATIVTGGTLKDGAANALPTGTALTVSNATFDLNGNAQTVGGLADGSVATGVVTNSGAAATFTVNDSTANSFSGKITGALALTKSGAGVLTLSGANTYSGDTTISAGTLKLGAANSIPGGASAGNVIDNGTLDVGGFSPSINGLSGSGVVDDSGAGTPTLTVGNNNATSVFSGVIQNSSGTLALTKTGTGVLTLSGTNTYSGATTISQGTLQLGADNVLPNGAGKGNVTVTGTLDMNGHNQTINALSGAGTVDNKSGTGTNTLTVGANNATGWTFSGTITNTSGSLAITKTGTGSGTLSGNDSYSGGTTISGGLLSLGNAKALGTGGLTMNGGTLNLNVYSISVANLSGNSGTILANNAGVGGSYTLTVGSDNTSTAYGGVIANNTDGWGETVGLTKIGSGVLTLSGVNTYSGATVIQSGGAINIQSANALGSSSATVNTGGALQIQGGITTAANALTLNGTGVASDGALRNISGNNTYAGAITLGSAARINSDAGQLTLSSGTAMSGAFALTVGGAGNTVISSAIGVASLTKDGTGVLTISGANTYSGDTTVSAGTLKLGAANVIPNGSGKGNVTDNGTLDMGGFNDSINGLSGNGTVDNSGGGTPTLTVGNNNATSVFAGTIQNTSGILALTKTGTGVLTLSGTNTYSGATTVGAGVLQAGSSGGLSANSAVSVSSGGTLDLNGQAVTTRSVTITSGGGLTNGVAGASLNNGLTNAGTVFVSQNTYLNGPVTNTGAMFFQGAISNGLVNSGSFNLNNNATLTVAPANGGTINVAASTLTVNPAWVNAGTVQLGGGVLTGGNLANNSGANVAGFGTVSNQLVNAGLVTATNGNLNLVGAATGAGAYRAVAGTSAATLTFVNGGSISSLFNTGATVQVESTLTNNSLFVNQGTIILNAGTYQSSANFTNALNEFVIASDDSTLSAASVVNRGTILTTNATLLVSNLVVQSGTITIGNSGTLMLVGAGALTNFGTINLVGAASSGNNAVLNLGTAALTNLAGGTITGGGIIQNASQVVNLLGGSILATSTGVELQFTNGNTFGNAGTIGASAGATLTFGPDPGSAIITNFGTINLCSRDAAQREHYQPGQWILGGHGCRDGGGGEPGSHELSAARSVMASRTSAASRSTTTRRSPATSWSIAAACSTSWAII